jgi:membrane fusion protein (multidrug efflux system)
VRVEVPEGPLTSVVSIPVSALRKGPAGDHVFVILPDSAGKPRAHDQPVQSGPVIDDDVVILAGLKPGQQVATSGSFKLRESVLVAAAVANNR